MGRKPNASRPDFPVRGAAPVTCITERPHRPPASGASRQAKIQPPDITEEALGTLVRGAADGDPAAFAEIHRLYGPAVLRVIRRRMPALLRRRYDSVDLQQSVFGDALADVRGFEFRGRAAFEGWLMQKLRWKLAERVRGVLLPTGGRREASLREGSRFGPESPDAPPSAASEDAENLEILRAAVHALGSRSREILILHHEEGLTFSAIAERLGLRSEDAARMRYARALVRLGDAWREE